MTREERLDPESIIQAAYDHYGLGDSRKDGSSSALLVDPEELGENVICLFSVFTLKKRLRVVIDHDPEYKASLIRILPDHTQ